MKTLLRAIALFSLVTACVPTKNSSEGTQLSSVSIGTFKTPAGKAVWNKATFTITSSSDSSKIQKSNFDLSDFKKNANGKALNSSIKLAKGDYLFAAEYKNAAGKLVYRSCKADAIAAKHIEGKTATVQILVCPVGDETPEGKTEVEDTVVIIEPILGSEEKKTPVPPVKPAVTMTLKADPKVLTIVERFDIPAGDQANAILLVNKHISSQWSQLNTFISVAILRGLNGGISTVSQWRIHDLDQPPVAVPKAYSLTEVINSHKVLDSRTFILEFTKGKQASTQFSVAATPKAHFGIFNMKPADQDRLLKLSAQYAPTTLEVPGFESYSFHRSLDGAEAINFTGWKNFDGVETLLKLPGFGKDDAYWNGIAAYQPDFFEVQAIILKD